MNSIFRVFLLSNTLLLCILEFSTHNSLSLMWSSKNFKFHFLYYPHFEFQIITHFLDLLSNNLLDVDILVA